MLPDHLCHSFLARHSFSDGGSKNQAVVKPYSWFTTVKEIAENDHILSANTYSPYNGEEEVNHRDPKEILREIETYEKKLESALDEVKKLI